MGPRSCERGNAHTTYYQCYVNWASMGPRSCERGNVVELGGDLFWKLRFNGAALVRARKCRIAAFWPFAEGQLQWGRARASAEISCNAAAKGHVDTASMGPRSCERGNLSRYARTRRASRSFNGAALVRARKFTGGLQHSLKRVQASMGPRSCERGNGSQP